MRKIVLLVGVISLSTSLYAAPKGVTIHESGFDGSKEVRVQPYGSSSCMSMKQTCLSVGASWTNREPDKVALDLLILGRFVNMKTLQINVDGDFFDAQSLNSLNDHKLTGSYKQSSQSYSIDRDKFEKILNANKVWFKVTTLDGKYIETNLIDSGKETLALQGLKRFSTEIK